MVRGTAAIAYSYFLHWLQKEDLYSQQSPFVFALYQGLIKQLAAPLPSNEAPANLASSSFINPSNRNGKSTRQTAEGQTYPNWKPTRKGVDLIGYFCSQTPAQQVLEIGTGNGALTRGLEQVTLGKLHSLEENQTLWMESKSKGSPTTAYHLGKVQEQLPTILQELDQLDFLLINPIFSMEELQTVMGQCLPKIHSKSVLAITHIHRSKEMEQVWATIQADPNVQLTMDFFDYGLIWFAYPGPKTHLILST